MSLIVHRNRRVEALGANVLFDGTVSPNGYANWANGYIIGTDYTKADNTTYFQLFARQNGTISNSAMITLTNGAIDMTSFTTLHVDCEMTNSGGHSSGGFEWSVGTVQSGRPYSDTIKSYQNATFARQTKTLDVSAANGNYYIKLGAVVSINATVNDSTTIKIYKVWLT